jgi:hypothetical protein
LGEDDERSVADLRVDQVEFADVILVSKTLENYASEWMSADSTLAIQRMLSVDSAMNNLGRELIALEYKRKFQHEVFLLIDVFARLFYSDIVGVRITPLFTAMCPRFHTDNIACRMIVTYGGLGTEWLLESNLDRRSLGLPAKSNDDHELGVFREQQSIQQLATQQVALLKESAWEGNEANALAHRSPLLAPGPARLLLTVDIV